MAENVTGGQSVFFVDDELIERLMRGDAAPKTVKPQRAASSTALARAVELASTGRLDDAVHELETAVGRGEQLIENYTGLGHLYFEKQAWTKAAESYSKVTELEPRRGTAHYNLGLCRERQGQYEDAAKPLRDGQYPSTRGAGRRSLEKAYVY